MKVVVLSTFFISTLFASSNALVESEKLQDSFKYTTSFNICVLEKIERLKGSDKNREYTELFGEASDLCSLQYAEKYYKRYKL